MMKDELDRVTDEARRTKAQHNRDDIPIYTSWDDVDQDHLKMKTRWRQEDRRRVIATLPCALVVGGSGDHYELFSIDQTESLRKRIREQEARRPNSEPDRS